MKCGTDHSWKKAGKEECGSLQIQPLHPQPCENTGMSTALTAAQAYHMGGNCACLCAE